MELLSKEILEQIRQAKAQREAAKAEAVEEKVEATEPQEEYVNFRDLCNERDHAKKRVAELEEMVKSAEKSLTAMGEGLLREDEVFRLIAQEIHKASTSVNGQMAEKR